MLHFHRVCSPESAECCIFIGYGGPKGAECCIFIGLQPQGMDRTVANLMARVEG